MTQGVQELYNQATEIYGRIKALLDADNLSAEQEAQLDTLFAAFDEKTGAAKLAEKRAQQASEISRKMSEIERPVNRLATPSATSATPANEERSFKAYTKALSRGMNALSEAELKDLSATTDAEVGRVS